MLGLIWFSLLDQVSYTSGGETKQVLWPLDPGLDFYVQQFGVSGDLNHEALQEKKEGTYGFRCSYIGVYDCEYPRVLGWRTWREFSLPLSDCDWEQMSTNYLNLSARMYKSDFYMLLWYVSHLECCPMTLRIRINLFFKLRGKNRKFRYLT